MTARTPFGLLAATLLLVGVACGGSDDDVTDGPTDRPTDGAATADPNFELIDQTGEVACALVTHEEVSEIEGEEYYDGEPSFADCTFNAKSSAFKTVRLGVSLGPGAEAIFGAFLAGEGVIEVEGGAGRAAWSESTGRLDVLTEKQITHVVVIRTASDDALTRALAIANAAID